MIRFRRQEIKLQDPDSFLEKPFLFQILFQGGLVSGEEINNLFCFADLLFEFSGESDRSS